MHKYTKPLTFLHKYTFLTTGGHSAGDTVLLLGAKKKFPSCDGNFSAVRTRLELVTPCVTGMYSNQLN